MGNVVKFYIILTESLVATLRSSRGTWEEREEGWRGRGKSLANEWAQVKVGRHKKYNWNGMDSMLIYWP
jgi:hypothetical protein